MVPLVQLRLHSLVLAALALLNPCDLSSTPETTLPRCRYGSWSSLGRAFAEDNARTAVARGASFATIRGITYLAGNDIPFFAPDTVRESPLSIARLGGQGIGRPSGHFRFVSPRLLADRAGRLHLLWGEPVDASAPVTGSEWSRQHVTAIWTASYDPARGWSASRKVYDGPEIGWADATSTDGDGHPDRAAVVATVKTKRAWPGVLRVWRVNGDSVVSSIAEIYGSPAYQTVALSGDTSYLAYIATSREVLPGEIGPHDNNSVWLQRSLDRGATWQKEILVSRSGDDPASQLRLHLTPDGTVHLLWRKDFSTGVSVIRHAESLDGGRNWSAPDDLHPSQSPFSNLHSVVDACGALQLVHEYMDPNTGNARLEVATWNGRWTRAEQLRFPGQRVGGAAIYREPSGRIELALLSVPTSEPLSTPPAMSYTERQALEVR